MAGRHSRRGIRRDLAHGRTVACSGLRAYILGEETRQKRILRIEGACFSGALDLRRVRLEHLQLELVNCTFEGDILLTGAVIESLDLTGSTMRALHADRLHVRDDFVLRGTRIGDTTGTPAVVVDPVSDGDRAIASRRVAEESTTAPLRLIAARIGGGVVLEGATLGGPGPWALFAPRAVVGDSLKASGLVALGALHLRDARITHSVLLDHATVGGVEATSMQCEGGFYGDWGFTSSGPVRLRGANIGLVVTFHDASLVGPAGTAVLSRLRTPRLRMDLREAPAGEVLLRDARIGSYVDSPGSWPRAGGLDVEGLTYERLGSTEPVGVTERLAWLARDVSASASSFEQLALSYQRAGHERSARRVRRAREQRLSRQERFGGRLWGALQDVLFGYGYAPGRALLWLMLLVGAGSAWFATHRPAPANGSQRRAWDPVLFTLDLIVPFANLGHRTAWDPTGMDKSVAVILIAAGWLLATAVVAGAHRALSRN